MKSLKNKLNRMRGFTLLELVIVIAIIGILAVIVLPNFINALAKARDAKKMTELRGIQTFLTTTGIDTSLRYPETEADLRTWMTSVGTRVPNGLVSGTGQIYYYAGLDCSFPVSTVLAGIPYANNCSSYQLYTELEVDNAALRLDSDLTSTATVCVPGVTGSCIKIDTIDTASSTLIAPAKNGVLETCTNRSTTLLTADCIFDLVP